MTNVRKFINPLFNPFKASQDFLTNKHTYQLVPDYIHDSLLRCHVCKIKYVLNELKNVKVGQYVCKFCINNPGGTSV